MKTRKINDEVLYSSDDILFVGAADIANLKSIADKNARKRIRLCAHPDEGNSLHEMLIALDGENYIRPHRHLAKSESFHVIEGIATVLIFDDAGTPVKRIKLGPYSSGLPFYFRLDQAVFHSVIVESDVFIFHETTNGPFNRADTEFAPWSPGESDVSKGIFFLRNSLQKIGGII